MQPRDRLTTKEIQVATLVWQGLTNRDIAGVLGTSEQVVKNYLRTAFDKLGGMDATRTRALRSQPWRSQLASRTRTVAPSPRKRLAGPPLGRSPICG